MTDDRMALAELLQKSGDGDFLRAVAEAVLQILMEADVEGLIGAGRHERSADRLNYRNGYRERSLDTRLGSLQLRIPKLRQGSYFPPFLEPRKTAEKALVTVIQEAWIGGVSTRRVDELVQAMGLRRHLEKPSLQAVQGHRRAGQRLPRPPDRGRVAVSLARRDLPQGPRRRPHRLGRGDNRRGGQRPKAGARSSACGLGPSEAEPFWSAFLKGLVKRGLKGVKLVDLRRS